MEKRTYIKTDEYTSYLAEDLLAMMNNQHLDIQELQRLVRSLIPSQQPEWFYTINETCKILSICEKQLYNLRISGEIHYREIGTAIRFSKSDIEEYQAKCRR
jgi:excisionase family DNA binding protein